MFSAQRQPEGLHSVAFRLTIFYALFFGLASVGGGGLLYHLVRGHILGEIDQDITRQMGELTRTLDIEGLPALDEEIKALVGSGGRDDYFVQLLGSGGETILSSDMSAWTSLADQASIRAPLTGQRLDTLYLPDPRQSARLITVTAGDYGTLQLGISLEDSVVFLDHLEHYGLIILGSMLSLGTLVGWVLALKAMAGVEAVTRAAENIADGHFADRVSAPAYGREIDKLVVTFNRMAERVETVMQEMRQVNDSIAHDLRSPLARIRGLAEAAVMDRTLCGEGDELAGSIIEECDRLMGLINTLLDIAEAEAGVQRLNLQPVSLAELADQAVELFSGVAEEKGVVLVNRSIDSALVQGDRRRLQRALANLVDNAIKHNPPGGRVSLEVRRVGDAAEILISDTGPGIAAEDLPHLFARFYRGDRARHLPGNGLGLSLALAVAHAHSGDIQVSSGPEGSTFRLSFPVAAA